jgi:hypothetical protein
VFGTKRRCEYVYMICCRAITNVCTDYRCAYDKLVPLLLHRRGNMPYMHTTAPMVAFSPPRHDPYSTHGTGVRPLARLLEMLMHHPAETLPQHPIPPPQPLHLDLPRKPDNPDPKRQFHLPIRINRHVDKSFLLFTCIVAAVCAAPDVLAGFTYAAGGIGVPFPGEVE